MGRHVLVYQMPPSTVTECPGSSLMPWSKSGTGSPRRPPADWSGAMHITESQNELLWWNSHRLDQRVILICSHSFSQWFWIQPSMGWWFWFQLTVVVSFCSQQIMKCTSVKIFNLNNYFGRSAVRSPVFPICLPKCPCARCWTPNFPS